MNTNENSNIENRFTARDSVSGIVDSMVYQNEENGYAVCIIETEDGSPVTLAGIIPYISEGDKITATGEWTTHRKYGKQFKVLSYDKTLPAEEGDILRYLASGAVKGIGPKTAQKIIEQFGTDAFEVIEFHPEWLSDIPGISPDKARKISDNFKSISGSREFMMFSRDFFPTGTAMRIYKKWGNAAVERIKNNPYSLCRSFGGIGFKRADTIAASIGLPYDSDMRITSGIIHVLSSESSRNGHTCLPESDLILCALQLLFNSDTSYKEKIAETIRRMISAGDLICYAVGHANYIYLPYIYKAEMYAAEKLIEISRFCPSFDENDIALFIEKSEVYAGIKYAKMQRQAISDALRDGVMILTGGPGTGKTTIIKGLLNIFKTLDFSVCLAAPTGRAAKRMSESTAHEAKTIHRLLEMEYGDGDDAHFVRDDSNPLDEKVIIIDEASMIDVMLMEALLKAIRRGSKLILIGDGDQIPSVGCGNVLEDVIDSDVFRIVRLNEVFRQSEKSLIITNAHKINEGVMPDISSKGTDFFFLKRDSDASTANTIRDLIANRLPRTYGDAIRNQIQVITPSRKGDAGSEMINSMLQAALNPKSEEKNEKPFRNIIFRVGDKVMQIKNNYTIEWTDSFDNEGFGVFNGDIGTVESIDVENEILTISFEDKLCEYDYSMLEELEHAYAITVHKSQGSEYPVVIVPMYRCAPMLRSRNLLYTAVTRASKMVILVGSLEILKEMVENNRSNERCTMLDSMLISEYEKFNELI